MAQVASPSWSPAYSSAATRNGPSRAPKSGTISRQARASWEKNTSRARASEAASRNTPAPETAACLTPPPARSSRHRPALSLSVTSTPRAFSDRVLARSPATVTKTAGSPPSLIFSRMSFPR